MPCLYILLKFTIEKTLTKFIHESVIKIAEFDGFNSFDGSEWKFYSYLNYEIVIYKTNLTIGNAVALPEHFYNKSNEKKKSSFIIMMVIYVFGDV